MAGGGQCSLHDGVRTSGRVASIFISLVMALSVVAMVQDEWLSFSSSKGNFSDWVDVDANGTITKIEFGIHSYCTYYTKEKAEDLGLPFGKSCMDYGDYVSSYFTEVQDTVHCDKFETAEVCFYMHKIQISLLCAFIVSFIGALFSEKPTATVISGLLSFFAMAAASIMVMLLEGNLRREAAGTTDFLASRGAAVAGTMFALFTFLLGCGACYWKPSEENSFRGYHLFNDNIELIGRIGSAFGQLAWLSYLMAALSNRWWYYEEFGDANLKPYNLENVTDGYIGLLGFCTGGSTNFTGQVTDSSKTFNCYFHNDKFGIAATRGCDIFGACDDINIIMGILFCGVIVGALADFFSEKMMIQGGLQLLAMALGVATLAIIAGPLNNPDNLGSPGEIDRGGFYVIVGLFLFAIGAAFCIIDGTDVCRIKPGKEPNCCQRFCSCGVGVQNISETMYADESGKANVTVHVDHDGDGVNDTSVSVSTA